MKLLLTSQGLSNKTIKKAFLGLLNKPVEELSLMYIPTALSVKIGERSWGTQHIRDLLSLNFKIFDVIDFSAVPKDLLLERLETADVFFVEGGNTFHLMHCLKSSGLDKLLPSLLEDRVYIGTSAGGVVLGEKLVTTASARVYSSEIEEFKGNDGLGILNFSMRPHYKIPGRPEKTKEELAEMAKQFDTELYVIDDHTGIVIDGDKVEVVSEGEWEKFELNY